MNLTLQSGSLGTPAKAATTPKPAPAAAPPARQPSPAASGDGNSPERPIKNLSIRIRRLPGETKLSRKPIDYSAKGNPVRTDPPLSVGPDLLLQRLKGGQR